MNNTIINESKLFNIYKSSYKSAFCDLSIYILNLYCAYYF